MARRGARCRPLRDCSSFNFRLFWSLEPEGLASGRDAKLAVPIRLEMHEELRVGRRVSAIRAPAPRFDEVDGRVVAVELRQPSGRGRHQAIDELRLSVDDFAEAKRLSHAIASDHGTLDQGSFAVALDLLEIIL